MLTLYRTEYLSEDRLGEFTRDYFYLTSFKDSNYGH